MHGQRHKASSHVTILEAQDRIGGHAYSQTLEDSVNHAQTHLNEAQTGAEIKDVAAEKGYHATEQLTVLAERTPYRTYIPEPELKHPDVMCCGGQEVAFLNFLHSA